MTSAVCPPRSHFTVTGRSPRFWSRPLGPPVLCLRPFTYVIFNTSSMAYCLWVRLWLRALGSGNPHLFLTCSGGGGGPTRSWSLLLRGFFTGCGACPTSADSVSEILPFYLPILLAIHFKCLYAFCLFYLSPHHCMIVVFAGFMTLNLARRPVFHPVTPRHRQ